MIEVFIAYTRKTPIHKLAETLNAWDTDEYEPVALQVKDVHNETLVRAAAESITKGDYIIAHLGSAPGAPLQIYKKGQGIKVEACSPRVQ